jgi:hypothetical protein
MAKEPQTINTEKLSIIYMSIDHLKQGMYQLNIICDNKIVESLKIKKS